MHFCNGGNLIIGGLEQKKGGNNEDYLLKPFLLKLKKILINGEKENI